MRFIARIENTNFADTAMRVEKVIEIIFDRRKGTTKGRGNF